MSDQIIPQRTDEVILYLDEDQRELDRLDRNIQDAARAAAMNSETLRLADDLPTVAAAEAYDEFKEQAVARGVTVALKAMPGRKWRALVGENPPRADHATDAEWGFNHLTLADVVVSPCIASIGGKALEGQALEDALDAMNDGDFSKVYTHILRLNTGQGPDPKDSISQRLRRSTEETSESPGRLA